MKEITWKMERRAVADFIEADYNPRKMSDAQRADLVKSITQFGQVEPVVVNADGTIIGGHQRLKAYADLGIKETDAMVPSRKLSKEEERELNIRLNKNRGEFDDAKLKEFFNVKDLMDWGFAPDELGAFFDKTAEVGEDDFDADAEAAAIKNAVTKTGDLWEMDGHRLICGDSTDPTVFEKLMGGVLADMCWTDPPYNVDYDYTRKYTDGMKQRKGRPSKFAGGTKVFNDNKTPEEFRIFLLAVFRNVYANTKDSSGIYVCHATKSQEEFFGAFKEAGFHFSQTIIWLKERLILALGQDYHRIYEPIMYGWKKGKKRWSNKQLATATEVWDLDKMTFEERLDVWYLNRDKSKDYQHPTQKPVRLPERAIKKSCPINGLVIEPFGGSGSALLACEQLQRRCYNVELDPRYCDVIMRRWQKYTGKKAKCLTRDVELQTQTP